jgi:hypothetical protein
MLAGLPPQEREEAWTEIAHRTNGVRGPDGFIRPCEMLVITGTL